MSLADQLGISRGPLREAVLRLTDDGLIVKEPYKGLHVRQTSLAELQELKSMRFTLETFAFKEAWDKRTSLDFTELDTRCAALVNAVAQDGRQFGVIDLEIAFHSWIFEVADHALLMSIWEGLTSLFSLYLSLHQKQFGFSNVFMERAKTYAEHAKADDLDEMIHHVRLHLDFGLDKVVSRYVDRAEIVSDQTSLKGSPT